MLTHRILVWTGPDFGLPGARLRPRLEAPRRLGCLARGCARVALREAVPASGGPTARARRVSATLSAGLRQHTRGVGFFWMSRYQLVEASEPAAEKTCSMHIFYMFDVYSEETLET